MHIQEATTPLLNCIFLFSLCVVSPSSELVNNSPKAEPSPDIKSLYANLIVDSSYMAKFLYNLRHVLIAQRFLGTFERVLDCGFPT